MKKRVKVEAGFARQFLADHKVTIKRGEKRILYPPFTKYSIKLPNTRFKMGDSFVDEDKVKRLSVSDMNDLGFGLCQVRIPAEKKWVKGQHYVYFLARKENIADGDEIVQLPYGYYIEMDVAQRLLRLVGKCAGPLGAGPWTYIDKESRVKDTTNQVTPKGYLENSDFIIDEVMNEWLGVEGEAETVYIEECPIMITDNNEVVCIPRTKDMPSLGIFGMKRCVTDDTLIDMPRDLEKYPDGVPVKELVGKENFYVYSFNTKNNKLEVKLCEKCEQAGYGDVYEVELVNGQKIRATEDHPFLLMDGTYKELKDLVWNVGKCKYFRNTKQGKVFTDRLRMFSRPTTLKENNIIKVDFNPIKPGETSYMHSAIEHRFVAEQVFGEVGMNHVHHKDGNHFNNVPYNLQIMSAAEHAAEHMTPEREFKPGNDFCRNTGYSTKKRQRLDKYSPEYSEYMRQLKLKYFSDEKFKESRAAYRQKLSALHKKKHGWSGGVIKEIRYVGKSHVYDLVNVADNHNFIANGFVVSNTGKSFTTHSIVSRLFWKPAFDFKIVVLNDSSKETGTWCMPNSDTGQIRTLARLQERPLPLPCVYLHPKVRDRYEKLYMGYVGYDITIPWVEIIDNVKQYLDLGLSGKYFKKFKDKLKQMQTQEEAENLLDTLELFGVPKQSAEKIKAHFEDLLEMGITDISWGSQVPWKTSKFPQRYNPVTACLLSGALPVLMTSYVSNDPEKLSMYFNYFVKDLFTRQTEDQNFIKQNSQLLLVVDEAHNISNASGKKLGADMLLRRCVREGGPRRVGTLITSQSYTELPKIIKGNTTYLIVFKAPGAEAQEIAKTYNMGKKWADVMRDLGKFECIAYSTEHFIVYKSDGSRRKSRLNEVFRGTTLPPYSMHKAPRASGG